MSEKLELISVNNKQLSLILDFLLPHEHMCVSLVDRVLRIIKSKNTKGQTLYAIRKKTFSLCIDSILGVFLITDTGIVLHHVIPCDASKLLKTFFQKKTLFSLGGTVKSSELFESLLLAPPKSINNYHLMQYSKQDVSIKLKKGLQESSYQLCKCTIDDEDMLYNLQLGYQYEEVLPIGKTISEKACRSIIKERLSKHTVFAILDKDTNKFVSMAGTNACGFNYVQLGGIYTDSAYRNNGFAQILVASLLQAIEKNVSLFVRTDNASAIKAYSNIGFKHAGSYRICYM